MMTSITWWGESSADFRNWSFMFCWKENGHQQKCWWPFSFHSILSYSIRFYVLLYRSILLYIARIIYLSMLFYAILWVSISFYVTLLKISWQGYSYCYNVLVICCFLPLAHITNLINFSFHRRQKCWRFLFYIAPNLPDRPFVYRCCNISE